MKIPSCPEFVGVVRLVIAGLATRLNCHQEDVEDLKVAVAEACNNAIIGKDAESEVMINCIVDAGKFSIIVADRGSSCAVKKQYEKKQPDYHSTNDLDNIDTDETWLLLIRALMDEVECKVERGMRRRITMVKYLGKQY